MVLRLAMYRVVKLLLKLHQRAGTVTHVCAYMRTFNIVHVLAR